MGLMNDPGIVRNRLKINAAISNARCFLAIQKEFGIFCAYLRNFLPKGQPGAFSKKGRNFSCFPC